MLDELESRLQFLIENQLLKALPSYKPEDNLAQSLAAVMHANIKPQPDGKTLSPDNYKIAAHPSTLSESHIHPRLLEALACALQAAGIEAGLTFTYKPTVTTVAVNEMTPGEMRILASFSTIDVTETRGMSARVLLDTEPNTIPSNAFLILQGTKIFTLNRSVINIGRRLDNHIVMDDPRVSRNHAQMRVIKGRFAIFDLNSSGGTFVNNQRISQAVLYPGDVISLAGVTLIFSQDIPRGRQKLDEESTVSTISSRSPSFTWPKEKKDQK